MKRYRSRLFKYNPQPVIQRDVLVVRLVKPSFRWIMISDSWTFSILAGQEGIEPPTFGFGDRRSANLATGQYSIETVKTANRKAADSPNTRNEKIIQFPGGRPFLFNNLCDDAGANCSSTLAYGKTQPFFHRNRSNQVHCHRNIVPWHHHLSPCR